MDYRPTEEGGSQGVKAWTERFTFAQVPLAMAKDPQLTSSDVIITMFILPWFGGKGKGWVTVDRIASGTGFSERGVRYSLRRLQRAGWFSFELSRSNATRRRFVAQWMTEEGYKQLSDRLGIAELPDVPRLTYEAYLSEGDAIVGRPEYRRYIRSKRWARKRTQIIRWAEFRCQMCNEERPLEVHHRTYERLGRERRSDLIALCHECHEIFHASRKLAESKPSVMAE